MSIAHTPNLYSLPPDEQVRVFTQLGLKYAPLPDGREWVHPDHLGYVDAGPKKGREADLMRYLKAQTDERSLRLVALGEARPYRREAFRAELIPWVRERLTGALPIPDSVEWQWKPKAVA